MNIFNCFNNLKSLSYKSVPKLDNSLYGFAHIIIVINFSEISLCGLSQKPFLSPIISNLTNDLDKSLFIIFEILFN